jgi:hypothetical protein
MIQCTKCKEFKLATEFSKDSKKQNGLTSHCKLCRNLKRKEHYYKNLEKEYNRRITYRSNNPEKVKASNRNTKLKRAYGITHDDYLEMFNKQNKKCACCNKEFDKLVVDHNHTTGVVRELLCNPCNTALGLLNEDVTVMQNMSNYVRKHNGIL